VVFATVGAAASTAFKGCKSSTPDRRTLPMYGEAHWKMMFSGRPMQVGGNPGKGWSAVGVVPSGDIVWIYGLDIGQ
jgi:hypothetical protein